MSTFADLFSAPLVAANAEVRARALSTLAPPLLSLMRVSIDDDWMGQNPGLWDSPLGSEMALSFVNLEDGIEESGQANYSDIDIIGRAEAYKVFGGSTNTEISLTLSFVAQGLEGRSLDASIVRDVLWPMKWFMALREPITDRAGISHAPPPVFLQLGQLFQGRMIVTSMSPKWGSPFTVDRLLPLVAELQLTFTRVRKFITNFKHNGPLR